MKFRVCGMVFILLVLGSLPPAARAQTAAKARLSPPELANYPRVEAYLQIYDGEGRFYHGLEAGNLQVLEDDQPLAVTGLREARVGAQFVITINSGPGLARRNSRGITRYLDVIEALTAWAETRRGTTVDDWNLLVTGGPEALHVNDVREWQQALQESADIDPKGVVPTLDGLFRAIELVSEKTVRPGMGRTVLFITAPLEATDNQSLANLIEQARTADIQVHVWMVAAAGTFLPGQEKALMDLAGQTGGQYFRYDGGNEFPSPETYFEPLRSAYRLEYMSAIQQRGAHRVVVEVRTDAGLVASPAVNFDLDIQPPNPTFLSPVLEIHRTPPPGQDESTPNAYLPQEHAIPVLVDFPDGRIRPLKRLTLFVDGTKTGEDREAPFDGFTWDLSAYMATGEHLLRVEAEDAFGLTGSSMDTVVTVVIDRPAPDPWKKLNRSLPALVGLAVVMAGAVLLLVLLVGGRLLPQTQRLARRHVQVQAAVQAPPVKKEPPGNRRPGWVNRLQWPQRHVDPKASAFLSRITETEFPENLIPIPITAPEITLGRDPHQATLVLLDTSVEALHARLVRLETGEFRLVDEGSTAGTWVNYLPVPGAGAILEHGDLVFIGRVAFRFTLRQPVRVRKPVVQPLDPAAKELRL